MKYIKLLTALMILTPCFSPAIEVDKLREIVQPLVGSTQPLDKRYIGIWAGIVTHNSELREGFGQLSLVNPTAPNENSIFEIASITKVFTGILAAQNQLRGKIQLNAPLSDYLKGSPLPSFENFPIQIQHLATHTSGLPRLPTNLNPKNPMDPYLEYAEKNLLEYLKSAELKVKPGTQYEYSNLGSGLLGHLLASVNRTSYQNLVFDTISRPLKMLDTTTLLNFEQQTRLVQGHLQGKPVVPWTWSENSALAGMGALKSSGKDLTEFIKANLALNQSELTESLEKAQELNLKINESHSMGLGWHIAPGGVLWHNGSSFGCSSILILDPNHNFGVILLANSALMDEKTQELDTRLDEAGLKILKILSSEHPFERVDRDLKVYDHELKILNVNFATIPEEPKNKKWIQLKLKHMVEIDQHMRHYVQVIHQHSYTKNETKYFYSQFMKRWKKIDGPNTRHLKRLLEPYQWFKISEFGIESDNNAWLLVQHADHDPEFQKHILNILEHLYPVEETNSRNYAYLHDRVSASWSDPSKRKPQRFGTQGTCVGAGKWEPIPIEDPKNVDFRRRTVGLPPLAEYILKFQSICK